MSEADRSDLLAWIERYRRLPRLSIRRLSGWRRSDATFRAIAARAEDIASRLAAHGIGEGDRVGLREEDGPAWHAAFFGILRAGAVAVPLDPSFPSAFEDEVARDLELALIWPSALVPATGGAPPPWPRDDPGRTAEVVLTSGTTGAARAVRVTHGNLRAVLDPLTSEIERYRIAMKILPPMRLAVALPLAHLYGQVMGVFLPPVLGTSALLLPNLPAPDLARALREERCWVLAAVPHTLELIAGWLRQTGQTRWGTAGMADRLARAAEVSWPRRLLMFEPLRRKLGRRMIAVVSGGAALDPEVESFWRALGYAIVQGYGLTETAPLATLTNPLRQHTGSAGRPLPGVEIRIAPDGEILVRGANVSSAAAGIDSEGWLHTGDLGSRDAGGGILVHGRKSDRIVTPGGMNLDPGPLAERLTREPSVASAVVLERPWGRPGALCAVLVARPGARRPEIEAAVRTVNEGLPDAARIRAWRSWPDVDFPRTATGKPRLAAVREWLAGEELAAGTDGAASEPDEWLAALAAAISGVPAAHIASDTRLADMLTSLERVELATRLETARGVLTDEALFDPEATIGELAAVLTRERLGAGTEPPAARPRRIPAARWRAWPLIRAIRFAFREACLRPLWRSFFAMDAAGQHHLAGLEPPFIIAANHLSELDPGVVLFGLPPRISGLIATTAMWEYFERARTGPALYALAVFGLDLIPLVQQGDWRPTLRIAGRVVDAGGCPLVYPEGERSTTGALLPLRPGIAVMARELGLPIVPCGAAGMLAVLPKGSRWVRNCWFGRAPIAVRFGRPLPAPRPGDDLDDLVGELGSRNDALVLEARRAAGRF